MSIISDTVQSVAENAKGLITGTNSPFSPQVAQLFGFNVPGLPLISARDYFLVQMESWFSSIPMSTQWIVLIEKYPAALNNSILQGLERTDGSKKGWDIDRAKSILTSHPYQKIVGCIFAHAVTVPGEQLNVDYVGVDNNRGFIPGLTSKNRSNFTNLAITFKEVNTSFIDFVLRPWLILAAHYGLVTRDPTDPNEMLKDVKTNIIVMQFTRTYQNISMVPRKIWTFFNAIPIQTTSEPMTYTDEVLQTNDIQWAFTHYTVQNNLYIPIPDIISRVANGQLPTVSPFQYGLNPFNRKT